MIYCVICVKGGSAVAFRTIDDNKLYKQILIGL